MESAVEEHSDAVEPAVHEAEPATAHEAAAARAPVQTSDVLLEAPVQSSDAHVDAPATSHDAPIDQEASAPMQTDSAPSAPADAAAVESGSTIAPVDAAEETQHSHVEGIKEEVSSVEAGAPHDEPALAQQDQSSNAPV